MFPLLLVALGIAFALSQNKKSPLSVVTPGSGSLPPSPVPLSPAEQWAHQSTPAGTLSSSGEVWVNPNNDPMGATVVIPEAPMYRTTDQTGVENIYRNGNYRPHGGSLTPQLITMAEGIRRDAESKGYLTGNRAVVSRPMNDVRTLIAIYRDSWRVFVK